MNSTLKQVAVKCHWFRQKIGEDFVISNIESENCKADIFNKVLPGTFSGIGNFITVFKA